jgi:hypothetical protein
VALAWMTERACTRQVILPQPEVDDATLIDAVAETWWRALKP